MIREVSFANSVSSEGTEAWVGRLWVDTVGDVGGDNVMRMVADARANGVSAFRQITQRFPSGLELPIEYNTVRLGGKSGLIAVGRNLQAVAGVESELIAAQQAREQDAWKLREVETRHRLLFDASDDPLLMLRTEDLRIVDANPAAIRAGALDASQDFLAAVAPQDRDALRTMLGRVSESGRAPRILLHLGLSQEPWLVRASLSRSAAEGAFLLQLAPVAPRAAADATYRLDEMIERLPDGFVLTDGVGTVRRANGAFLDLVQTAVPGDVIGHPIGRWLSRPGADGAVLVANVNRHGVVRGFSTSIQGDLGTEVDVEISAASDTDSRSRHIGMLVRDVGRRASRNTPSRPPATGLGLIGPLTNLSDQIGRVPLLQLVRDTGGVIERHYIEEALERANGNRTAAAELLGLSRQSLYAKLSRYGLGGGDSDAASAED